LTFIALLAILDVYNLNKEKIVTGNIYKDYVPPSGGGLYHKFEDGVTYIFRIASDPVVYETHYTDNKTGDVNVSTKYAWVAWNVEAGEAQILQLPVTAYKMVASFASDADYGDPKEYNLKITRKGMALDTTYTVIASPKKSTLAEIDKEAPGKVADVDLVEVVSKGKGVAHVFWLSDAIGKDSKAKMALKQVEASDYPEGEPEDKKPVDLSEIPF